MHSGVRTDHLNRPPADSATRSQRRTAVAPFVGPEDAIDDHPVAEEEVVLGNDGQHLVSRPPQRVAVDTAPKKWRLQMIQLDQDKT
jgi:hypothetical protein